MKIIDSSEKAMSEILLSAHCRKLFCICLGKCEIRADCRFLELLKHRVGRVAEAVVPEHRRIGNGEVALAFVNFIV